MSVKYIYGLRVVDIYGRPLSFPRALVREASKFLSLVIFFIGYIMAGFTERKQALHDMIASTYVIHTEPDITVPLPYDQRRNVERIRNAERIPQEREEVRERV